MNTLDFSSRSAAPELMDTEAVSFEEFRDCLRDLARVNRLSFAHGPTLAFLKRILKRHPGNVGPIQILDVGSGYGDLLREVDRWAQRWGIPVALTGVDLNPWSRRAAEEASLCNRPIRWVTADAFAYQPPEGVDIVLSSLFTHHLTDPQVVRFLRWMDNTARYGWFINDLHRHPLPYHFFTRFARMAHYHRFVQHDGPVSIARAFTAADWQRLLAEAGVAEQTKVHWQFPFRLTVESTGETLAGLRARDWSKRPITDPSKRARRPHARANKASGRGAPRPGHERKPS